MIICDHYYLIKIKVLKNDHKWKSGFDSINVAVKILQTLPWCFSASALCEIFLRLRTPSGIKSRHLLIADDYEIIRFHL